METWGTNPRAMFDDVRQALAYSNRTDHPDWATKLRGQPLENQFAEIDGSAKIADDPSIAQFAGGIRAVQSMAKLGGSVNLQRLSDVATAASELRFQGENLGTAYTGLLANFLEGRASKRSAGSGLRYRCGAGRRAGLGHDRGLGRRKICPASPPRPCGCSSRRTC
jgi:hypothetical protein